MIRRQEFGDGPPCPELTPAGEPAGHGRMYRLDPPRSGREWWCPVTGASFPDEDPVMPLQGGGGAARLARADKRERR